MLNVYVHARVHGLATDLIYDDAFADALFEALPDLSLGSDGVALTITLSQFALTDRCAADRQLGRIRRALAATGHQDGVVELEETVREGWRDDVGVLLDAARWYAARLTRRV